jgi:oligopeptide/dipeptide ABC transporter ATP-binding protein
MAIMYLGRFVEQGSSEDIFRHPRHPYTKALLSANPNPDPDAETERLDLVGEVPSLLQLPSGCEFHTRCPFAKPDCSDIVPSEGTAAPGHAYRCLYPLKDV